MFFNASQFPALVELQSSWKVIRDELLGLNQTYFVQWPERNIYTGDWKVFGLYKFGEKIKEHCSLCPETTRILQGIPGLTTAGFSSLTPNTHITPHVGYTNQVLRCHLGLITTENCAIRVGHETRSWEPGSCFVFDDTYEHEAWNKGPSTRVVLLLDFKRDVNSAINFPEALRKYDTVSTQLRIDSKE